MVTISREQQASWVRSFNPLLAEGSVRFPTLAGIYEPMLIFNTMKGEYTPWLAAKITTRRPNDVGRSRLWIAARRTAIDSSSPRLPGGLVSSRCRARALSAKSPSGGSIRATRRATSSAPLSRRHEAARPLPLPSR